MNKKLLASAGALVALGVAAGGAFTASSAVPDHKVGQDVGAITGYVTSGVTYTYDTAGTTITHVAFTLDGVATTVKSRVNSTTTPSYVTCTDNTATTTVTNDWTCDIADVAVSDSTGLDVFASSI